MKKILLLALLLPAIGFSQEKETLSIHLDADFVGKLGFTYEIPLPAKDSINNKSFYVAASFSAATLETVLGYPDIDGTGTTAEIGFRTYWSKKKYNGWYNQGGLEYGSIKFDQNIMGERFNGKYRYISFFNPSIGYKAKLGKFSIDPSVGFQWNIEIKGKGDFDNNYVDNTSLKLGLKVGYSF